MSKAHFCAIFNQHQRTLPFGGVFSFMIPEKFIPSLEKLASKYNEPDLIINLCDAIRNEQAFPVFHYDMFFVFKPIIIESRKGILVWVGIHSNRSSQERDFNSFEKLAKVSQCEFLRFETKRKGFKRHAPKYGYHHIGKREDYDIYQKEVS